MFESSYSLIVRRLEKCRTIFTYKLEYTNHYVSIHSSFNHELIIIYS
jgi:hypothetical protein